MFFEGGLHGFRYSQNQLVYCLIGVFNELVLSKNKPNTYLQFRVTQIVRFHVNLEPYFSI
jgi:hypothetical protein